MQREARKQFVCVCVCAIERLFWLCVRAHYFPLLHGNIAMDEV